MTRKRKDWLFWITIFVIIFGQSFLVIMLLTNNATSLDVIGWITGGIIPSFALLYDRVQKHSIRFFLFAHRIKTFFNTSAPTWSLSARFNGENIGSDTLEKILSKITSHRRDRSISYRKINANSYQVIITPGPTFDIDYNRPQASPVGDYESDESSYIYVSIRNYRVGYRESAYAIKYEINPILEDISNIIPNVDSKYTLTIEFNREHNPFFSLYLANVDPMIISSFGIRIAMNDFGSKNTVQISETKVHITTTSQHALQNLVLEFLTFDLRLRGRLTDG